MSSRNRILAALGLCAALLVACGPSEEEAKTAARAEEFAAIEADHAALTELRAQLAAAREAAEATAASSSGEGEPAEAAAAGGEASAGGAEATLPEGEGAPAAAPSGAPDEQALKSQVDAATDRFLERLVTFINEYAGFEGEEPAVEVAAAIRLKSGEDMILAREYIERGGDYAKAIDILQSAQGVDPDNPDLAAALADAERMRYMDQERFSRIEKGMTEADVRRELGQVKHQNVRKYEDGKVVAWFYPREGGAAAAVFFRPRDEQLRVYDTNFDAVKSAAERAAAGETDEDAPAD